MHDNNGNDFIRILASVLFISSASHENDGYDIQSCMIGNQIAALHTNPYRSHLHVIEFQLNMPLLCL